MLRVFASRLDGDSVELSEQEWHHLLRVRRAADGEPVEALDGRGTAASCRLCLGAGEPRLEVVSRSSEPPPAVTLAVSLVRRERFEWVVQKAAELGAAAVVPLITERTEPRAVGRPERQRERWHKILVEALKQSGTRHLPDLDLPVKLSDWLQGPGAAAGFVFLDAGGGPPGPALGDTTAVLVGPEGGWSTVERRLMRQCGGTAVALGARTLRTETAAVVGLALAHYESGRLAAQPAARSDGRDPR